MPFIAALQFLTAVPVLRGRVPSAAEFSRSVAFFPLVGVLIGLALVGIDALTRLAFPDVVAGALVLASIVLLTGAMHFEGFIDACDGLFGGHTKERRLEILKDPRAGAYGVLGGGVLLILKWSAFASLPNGVRPAALVLAPVLGRWAMALAIVGFPYARQEGLGTAFRPASPVWSVVLATAVAALAGALLFGAIGAAFLGLGLLLTLGLGRWCLRLVGGMTGDLYGALNEVVEACVLLMAVALAHTGHLSPFLWGD